MVNGTTPEVILSPDPSLSYDRIKLGLDEYRTLLASDSDMIELPTENGKTIICRKQANEMEEYLDEAEKLLRDAAQSCDVSVLVVLRDLAAVLDDLKLNDECRLAGDLALDFAQVLGRQSPEFRQKQAETVAHIAGLSAYQSHARTLFTLAVSISEEVVANNSSHSNKEGLFLILSRAGAKYPGLLRVQWLETAVRLMTKELPQTMVEPIFCSVIYNNYGIGLSEIKQYSSSLEAYEKALSIRHTLAKDHSYDLNFACMVANMGSALRNIGKYDDAIRAYKKALEMSSTMSAEDPLYHDQLMARTLYNYGVTLMKLNQVSEAAEMGKQAISRLRNLAQTGNECTKWLCDALYHYGYACFLLGKRAEAANSYQESIFLRRPLAETDTGEERELIMALHHVAKCFLALDRRAEAAHAAKEVLQKNDGRVLEDCDEAPNFNSCFVCQRATIADPLEMVCRLPFFSSPRPAEHSEAGAAHASTSTIFAHISPINEAS